MNILAFDTCLDKMYVSLCKNDDILPSEIIETTNEHYHSAFLISTIRDVLSKNGLSPTDIDVIATNIGPGSFTGIRACITVARVFSQAANIKTIGVSSLEILSKINRLDKKTLVALDARKEMAYVAVFESGRKIFEPQTVLIDNLKEMIKNEDYFIINDDKLKPILGGISYSSQEDDLGRYLLEIVQDCIVADVDTDWRKLHPLYIQPPPVTIKKQ